MLPSNNKARRAYKTWIYSFRYLLPFKYATTLAIFLNKEPIDNYLYSTNEKFTNEELFNWTYRLHKFANDEKKKQTRRENVFQPSLNQVKKMYSNIHKKFWANPMWIVIHGLVALYPTFPSKEYQNFQEMQYQKRRETYQIAYKTFLYSLKYILPCELCRKHLKKNLSKINLDDYLDAPIDLFYFTWKLHSIVNKHVGNKNISFEQASILYGIKI
jgi:hypothetical protein